MENSYDHYSIKRERANLMLFAAGKGVSILGSSIYSFVIGLHVLNVTGSALNFATTIMLGIIPMVIISPIAGVIADRIPKKWLVVGMDVVNGLLFLFLFILTSRVEFSLPMIYASTVLLNLFTTFFSVGIEAAKPNLVTPNKLIRLNAIGKLIDSSSAILGPILGGIVYVMVDIRAFILFNSLSFLASAFTEWFIDYNYYKPKQMSDLKGEVNEARNGDLKGFNAFKADLIEGGRYFFGTKSILELFFVFVSLNFLFGFSVNVPAPYIINEYLELPPKAYGLINAMFPIGLIIGTLTVEKLMKRFEFRLLLISMNAFLAILASLIGLPTLFPVHTDYMLYVAFYGTLFLLMGIAIAYVDVPIMMILQTEVPEALRGRVMSLVGSLVKMILPLALLLSGALISIINIALIPVLGATAAFSYSAFLLIRNKKRNVISQVGLREL